MKKKGFLGFDIGARWFLLAIGLFIAIMLIISWRQSGTNIIKNIFERFLP